MLDSIWHLRGSVALRASDPDDVVLDRVEQLLVKQRKPIFDRGSSKSISFDSPFWTDGTSNWAAMAMYDQGKIWISQEANGRKLRYDLRCFEGFILCFAFAAILFAVVGLAEGLKEALVGAGMAFGWLYGANIILALIRVPLLLRQAVRSVR